MKGKAQKGSPCEAIPFEERYKAEGFVPQWVRLANGFGWRLLLGCPV